MNDTPEVPSAEPVVPSATPEQTPPPIEPIRLNDYPLPNRGNPALHERVMYQESQRQASHRASALRGFVPKKGGMLKG